MRSFFEVKSKLKNIVFIGGISVFKELTQINKKHKLGTLIVTSPDQRKEYKLLKNIKSFNKIDEKFKKYIKSKVEIKKTLFISLGYRFIFQSNDIKNFFNNNLVNFHGSRLPFDRGGGGHSWRILRNDRIDNQLVHIVDGGIDSGLIIDYNTKLIPRDCILPYEIEKFRLSRFLSFYESFLTELIKGKKFYLKDQPEYLSRYNPRLNTKINGWIDWNLKSDDLIKFINAFDEPYAGASTMIGNQRVYIKSAQIHGGESSNHPFMSGIISRHDKSWINVCTTDSNMLLIEKVLNKNNKNIISELKVGDRFYTEMQKIESSKSSRVKYNSKGFFIKK